MKHPERKRPIFLELTKGGGEGGHSLQEKPNLYSSIIFNCKHGKMIETVVAKFPYDWGIKRIAEYIPLASVYNEKFVIFFNFSTNNDVRLLVILPRGVIIKQSSGIGEKLVSET